MDFIIENWKVIALIISSVLLWYKDFIFIKLGVKKDKKAIEFSAAEILEKNLNLYQEMLGDIDKRYKTRIKELEDDFNKSLSKLMNDLEIINTINEENKMMIKEQKALIIKQQKNLAYYKEKCSCK